MHPMTLLLLFGGLALLAAGAEALVRGASRLALAAGISPLVIGLTVVAYGTSMPELVVSTLAALDGQPDLAVANVVGSNVLNVLFILGLCAALVPLTISRQVWRREVPIMIGASLLLVLLGADGRIARWEAAMLLAGIVGYSVSSVRASRRESVAAQQEAAHGEGLDRPATRGGLAASVAWVVAGLGALVLGARWLVEASVTLARAAGVSDVVIGLTIVAVGTSLPELATSVVATLRGAREMAIGNVVGSNIYNLLAILGVAGAVSPGGLEVHPSLAHFDIPVMSAVAVACLPLFFTGRTLARWEGLLFLGYYAAYTLYVVLHATGHDTVPAYARVMWAFVLPITVVTIAVVTVRAVRAERVARVVTG
jgi:cation:H+ antiporter